MAVLLTITGCGGGGNPASEPESSTPSASSSADADDSTSSPPEPELSNKQIETHFSDLFSQEPRLIAKATKMTAQGSLAEIYATYRMANTNSNLDGGYPQDPWDVAMGSDTLEACPSGGDCVTIADFVIEDGKLTGYTFNGKSLEKRLVMG